jgi:putative DNA primase/helicase
VGRGRCRQGVCHLIARRSTPRRSTLKSKRPADGPPGAKQEVCHLHGSIATMAMASNGAVREWPAVTGRRNVGELFDRAPPADVAMEWAVLGSILLKPDCFGAVAPIVTAADFHDPVNRRIFQAIESLHRAGKPIDPKLLLPRLTTGNGPAELCEVTAGDLAELLRQVPTAANAVHYAKRIADLAKRRGLLLLAAELTQAAHGERPTDVIVAEAVGQLATIQAGPRAALFDPVIVRLSEVEPQPVQWLWPGRIALGKLTLLAGDPGLGKSCLSLDLAARVSLGSPWPDDRTSTAPRGSVVLLGAEDGLNDTVRPRLDAMGADTKRIFALQGVKPADEADPRAFNLARYLPALEEAIRAAGDCRLVVVDPITAYLGETDSHKNADVRALLHPLCELADRRGVAVVAVTHLNKGNGAAAMYRATGSLAFVATARAAWLVTRAANDASRRLLLPMKNNLGGDTRGMAFTIRGGVVEWEPEPVPMDADQALAALAGGDDRDDVGDWLREGLAGRRVPVTELMADAEANGITPKQLRGAMKRIGAKSRRTGFGKGSSCEWYLPTESQLTIDSLETPYLPDTGDGNVWESMGDGDGPNGRCQGSTEAVGAIPGANTQADFDREPANGRDSTQNRLMEG